MKLTEGDKKILNRIGDEATKEFLARTKFSPPKRLKGEPQSMYDRRVLAAKKALEQAAHKHAEAEILKAGRNIMATKPTETTRRRRR